MSFDSVKTPLMKVFIDKGVKRIPIIYISHQKCTWWIYQVARLKGFEISHSCQVFIFHSRYYIDKDYPLAVKYFKESSVIILRMLCNTVWIIILEILWYMCVMCPYSTIVSNSKHLLRTLPVHVQADITTALLCCGFNKAIAASDVTKILILFFWGIAVNRNLVELEHFTLHTLNEVVSNNLIMWFCEMGCCDYIRILVGIAEGHTVWWAIRKTGGC